MNDSGRLFHVLTMVFSPGSLFLPRMNSFLMKSQWCLWQTSFKLWPLVLLSCCVSKLKLMLVVVSYFLVKILYTVLLSCPLWLSLCSQTRTVSGYFRCLFTFTWKIWQKAKFGATLVSGNIWCNLCTLSMWIRWSDIIHDVRWAEPSLCSHFSVGLNLSASNWRYSDTERGANRYRLDMVIITMGLDKRTAQ